VYVEGFIGRDLIGGFRKLTMPPVLLHRLKDPSYAETEISIDPYPTLPGEPTQICVDLRNLSNVTQTVDEGFMAADFGIGLPYEGWRTIGECSAARPRPSLRHVDSESPRTLLCSRQPG
jgi:hypothetical protein